MFSEETKRLADEFWKLQQQLDESIQKDTDGYGKLCVSPHLQIWFDDTLAAREIIEILPAPTSHCKGVRSEHIYYTLGSTPFVSLVTRSQTLLRLLDKDGAAK